MKERFLQWWPVVFISAVTAIAYYNSFNGQFLLDDWNNIYNNPSIKQFSDSFAPPDNVNIFRRQFVNVTLAFNYAISGFDVWSYHLLNLIIHIVGAVFLFGIAKEALRSDAVRARHATVIAAGIASLWAVHPLQTQAVTYVIQRCESLLGMCVLMSLYFAIRSMKSDKPLPWQIGSIAVFLVGVWVKEAIFTIPVLVLLYDFVINGKSAKASVKRNRLLYLGYALCLVALAYNLIQFVAVKSGPRNYSAIEYAITQPEVILHYLKLAIFPMNLTLDYLWLPTTSLQAIPYILAVSTLIGLSVWLVVRKSVFGFFLGVFWVTLLPSSSIFPINDIAFEHRMYLPLAGFCGVVTVALYDGLRLMAEKTTKQVFWLGVCVWLGILAVATVRTHDRNADYAKGELFMWEDVIKKRPKNTKAYSLVGKGYAQSKNYEKALIYYTKCVEIDPDHWRAHNDLYTVHIALGNKAKAQHHLYELIRIVPNMPMPYIELGKQALAEGDVDNAVSLLEQAIKCNPELYPLRAQLAQLYYRMGRWSNAVPHLKAYLDKYPTNRQARQMLNAIR